MKIIFTIILFLIMAHSCFAKAKDKGVCVYQMEYRHDLLFCKDKIDGLGIGCDVLHDCKNIDGTLTIHKLYCPQNYVKVCTR